jgi:Protein of unknown function (DUF3795)
MKQEIIAKCGNRCDLCLAYLPNVEKKDQRSLLSDAWFNIYGFRVPPQDIICTGCVSGENPVLIDKECPVRPCVTAKNLKNCGYCEEYICDKLKQRMVNRTDLENKLNRKLTRVEYEKFVRPYDSKERLDRIRKQ